MERRTALSGWSEAAARAWKLPPLRQAAWLDREVLVRHPAVWRANLIYAVPALAAGYVISWGLGQVVPVDLVNLPTFAEIQLYRTYLLLVALLGLGIWILRPGAFPRPVFGGIFALASFLLQFLVILAALNVPIPATMGIAHRLAALVTDDQLATELRMDETADFWRCTLPETTIDQPILAGLTQLYTLDQSSFFGDEHECGEEQPRTVLRGPRYSMLSIDLLRARVMTVLDAKAYDAGTSFASARSSGWFEYATTPFGEEIAIVSLLFSGLLTWLMASQVRPRRMGFGRVSHSFRSAWTRARAPSSLPEPGARGGVADAPFAWTSQVKRLSLVSFLLTAVMTVAIEGARYLATKETAANILAFGETIAFLVALGGIIPLVLLQNRQRPGIRSLREELVWVGLCLAPVAAGLLPLLVGAAVFALVPPDENLGFLGLGSTSFTNWTSCTLFILTFVTWGVLMGYTCRLAERLATATIFLGSVGLTISAVVLQTGVTSALDTFGMVFVLAWLVLFIFAVAWRWLRGRVPPRLLRRLLLANVPFLAFWSLLWWLTKSTALSQFGVAFLIATLAILPAILLVTAATSGAGLADWRRPKA